MLGDTVREARLRKGLTQARLAQLAGVSRRHLAALEKGANVSVAILERVAGVLELSEITIGDLALRKGTAPGVNVALLTDSIREARAETERAQLILARAETLLAHDPPAGATTSFPTMPIRHIEAGPLPSAGVVRERPERVEIELAGEVRHGAGIDETKKDRVQLPHSLVGDGEIVLRARGEGMRDHGIEDGDLLIVEPRPRGRAASGELVIGRVGQTVFVGRWWQKHGRRSLMSHGLAEVTVSRDLRVVAAINQVVRRG
jgi:transcriptional regulator with XRE-family HTH domain